jgi:hypothetical protein
MATVKCPKCDWRGKKHGLKIHDARKHTAGGKTWGGGKEAHSKRVAKWHREKKSKKLERGVEQGTLSPEQRANQVLLGVVGLLLEGYRV